MPTGALTGYIDVAQVTLYIFWLFFAGLVFYIRREDRREGYPLETDLTGQVGKKNKILMAKPKEYKLPEGGSYFAPNDKRDTRNHKIKRVAPWPGSPYEPTGDPMVDGVGPASWAERHDEPELTRDGKPALMPLRASNEYDVAKQKEDPRGMEVFAGDKKSVGKIKDIWVDRSENQVRYLEATLQGGSNVLIPVTMLRIQGEKKKYVHVQALMSEHFPKVPRLAKADQVTILEEEKIQAFFAGGKLYGKASRMGPLL
ncbi:MAG TPA: photosynthetic reaction center subunit H [Myxococcales bacterium LLY-WYZ-16_1]|nr:photosynthetic reaction center subunit H [Myxococcales bacterium LLY-WYZ-16_1]